MKKIYKNVQKSINCKLSFEKLYFYIKELDILDIHFHIHKLILKSNIYLINYPPEFSELLCLYLFKPDIVDNKKLISFYTFQQKVILTYFILEDNDYKEFPDFFLSDYNILILQRYIHYFNEKIFLLLIKNFNLNEISLLVEKYDNDNILNFLINNTDIFTFQQIVSNLFENKWLEIIKKLEIPDNYYTELKKYFKNSSNYTPSYLLFVSKVFKKDNEDIFIEIFLQQKNQTKFTVCPHLPINIINKLFIHFNYISLQHYDFSWINFTESQENIIKEFIKQKSIKINKILSEYNPQTISKKYDFLKKNITIFTSISNAISNEKTFLITESNLNKLFQAGTISYFGKNQYT